MDNKKEVIIKMVDDLKIKITNEDFSMVINTEEVIKIIDDFKLKLSDELNML
jgi:hypothetical protein